MRVIISGAMGFMGRELSALCEKGARGAVCVGKVDIAGGEGVSLSLADCTAEADVLIDFSNHLATLPLLEEAVKRNLPAVIATTGHTEEEKAKVLEAAKKIPIFFSYNTSLGVAVTARLVKEAAARLGSADIEIIETHHNRKLDAPSGTAIMLAESIKEARPELYTNIGRSGICKREPDEIGISSIRSGNIVGIHEVILNTGNETVTIRHEAHSRALFAEGALSAAEFLIGKGAGLYSMRDIME